LFSYEKKDDVFERFFHHFLKEKVKKISRLELGEQLRHSSSKVARYSKES
jgi:hypothetical protein